MKILWVCPLPLIVLVIPACLTPAPDGRSGDGRSGDVCPSIRCTFSECMWVCF